MAKSIYILDGHYQIFRAYYARFGDLTSPDGEPTKATHVFFQMLLSLLRDRKPDYLVVTLDTSDETVFRCDIDPQYKANRDPAPEDFHVQADRIVEILETAKIPILRLKGFEADDLAATLCEQLKSEDVDAYLVSRDKDLEQLIDEHVMMYDPTKDEVIDAAGLEEKKGYSPDKAVEIQTLCGDNTDNIPGIKGIGIKKAAKLIAQYGTAEAVLAHADELTPKMRENVEAFEQQMPITRQLVTLRRDVPLEFDLASGDCARFALIEALPIFETLGFNTIRTRWGELAGQTNAEAEANEGGEATAPSDGMLFSTTEAPVGGDYELVATPHELDALVADLSSQSEFAFDTETTGANAVRADLVGLSFSWEGGTGWYVPVRAPNGQHLDEPLVVDRLRPVFENAAIGKIAHNLKFDALVLKQVGIELAGPLFDTMIASFLLDPRGMSHGLKSLARALFGHQMTEIKELIGTGKKQITLAEVEASRTCAYAAADADFTWRLKEHYQPRLPDSPVEKLFLETEMPLVSVLTEMEHNGIALDVACLTGLGVEMEEQILDLRDRIHREADRPFNVDSPKQLAEVLFDDLGMPVIKKTKTGRSTDAETLEALTAQTEHPIPRLVLQYRELAKLKGTYVDTLPEMVYPATGRIHASFSQAVAATGRLASHNPNLQNIPVRTAAGRRIREAFVTQGDDRVLFVADYSQIELRLLAHFCRDEALMSAFARGDDIHRFVAAQIHGLELDEVKAEQRSAAKAVNFGIIYGQTAFGLARSLGIPRTEARDFIDRYFERYPGIRSFIDRCIADARENGYAETILGRRRPIAELKSRNRQQVGFGERIAVNTVVQGSAADLIKRAMIEIHRELQQRPREPESPSTPAHGVTRMLVQVHDELVFETDESLVESEAQWIRAHMAGAIELDVPLVVDIGWGKNWLDAK